MKDRASSKIRACGGGVSLSAEVESLLGCWLTGHSSITGCLATTMLMTVLDGQADEL